MEIVGIIAVFSIAPVALAVTLYYSWKVAP